MDEREAAEFARIAERLAGQLDLRPDRGITPWWWGLVGVAGLGACIGGLQLHVGVSFLGWVVMLVAAQRLVDPVLRKIFGPRPPY